MDRRSDTPTPNDPMAPPLDRLACYLYLADLIEGRRVLEVGCGDGRGAEFLARRGARRVTGIDATSAAIDGARRHRRLANLEFRRERLDGVELEDDSFDCIFVPDGARILRWPAALDELRRLLSAGGQLVLSAASADRPGAAGGASYYEVLDRLESRFAPVRMIAQAPLAAVSLVAYGEAGSKEPEIELDTSLREMDGPADETAEVCGYIALCGEIEPRERPFAIVQLPTAAGIDALAAARDEPTRDGDEITPEVDEATISQRISEAMVLHAERARDLEASIEEHRALADELADELARARDLRAGEASRARRAEAQLQDVEAQLARWRTRAAVAEGELLARRETSAAGDGDADGWAANKEEQLKTFSRELGTKEAELALMHVGLSSIRERLREVVGHVRDTRAQMQGRAAAEMIALMDRLSERLAVYEGMAVDEREA